MDYRNLGKCGLKVSPICLGTMMFGDRTDEAEAGRIINSARSSTRSAPGTRPWSMDSSPPATRRRRAIRIQSTRSPGGRR